MHYFKVIYGIPGEAIYCSEASTSITHHNICPDFYKEVFQATFLCLYCICIIYKGLNNVVNMVLLKFSMIVITLSKYVV